MNSSPKAEAVAVPMEGTSVDYLGPGWDTYYKFRKLEQKFEKLNPKATVAKARLMKKAMSISKRHEKLTGKALM